VLPQDETSAEAVMEAPTDSSDEFLTEPDAPADETR
jgi:hypothetical protein